MDGELSKNTLVTVDDLIVGKDHRCTKNVTFKFKWSLRDVESPFLD